MKYAITGATGQLGRIVVKELSEKVGAENVVALVRSPEKAADLGVETRQADYTKPETLAPALAGVDKLYFISASDIGQRVPQHTAVVEAAKAADVGHIVYTSLLGADHTALQLAEEHRATEDLIKKSGIPYTFMRHGWYTENYADAIKGALQANAVFGAAKDGQISAATRADYAKAGVAVLTSEGHENKTYELAGDTAFTMSDLAQTISAVSGKEVTYNDMDVPGYAKVLASIGLPEAYANLLAALEDPISQGALFDDSKTLSQLTGQPTTPLRDTVAATLA